MPPFPSIDRGAAWPRVKCRVLLSGRAPQHPLRCGTGISSMPTSGAKDCYGDHDCSCRVARTMPSHAVATSYVVTTPFSVCSPGAERRARGSDSASVARTSLMHVRRQRCCSRAARRPACHHGSRAARQRCSGRCPKHGQHGAISRLGGSGPMQPQCAHASCVISHTLARVS